MYQATTYRLRSAASADGFTARQNADDLETRAFNKNIRYRRVSATTVEVITSERRMAKLARRCYAKQV